MKRTALILFSFLIASSAYFSDALAVEYIPLNPITPPTYELVPIEPQDPGYEGLVPCEPGEEGFSIDSFSADENDYAATIAIDESGKFGMDFFGRLKVGTTLNDLNPLVDEFPSAPDAWKQVKIVVWLETIQLPKPIPALCAAVPGGEADTKGPVFKCTTIGKLPTQGKGCTELVNLLKDDKRKVLFSAVRVFGVHEGDSGNFFCNASPPREVGQLIKRAQALGKVCTESQTGDDGGEATPPPAVEPEAAPPPTPPAVGGFDEGGACNVMPAAPVNPMGGLIIAMALAFVTMKRRG